MNIYNGSFFPSLYDHSNANMDIWASLFHSHGTMGRVQNVFEQQPWPDTNTLRAVEYQPLDIFCPPEGPPASWSEVDDVCELAIRLKEIELVYQMGDNFDDGRYHFLSTLQYEKIKQLWMTE